MPPQVLCDVGTVPPGHVYFAQGNWGVVVRHAFPTVCIGDVPDLAIVVEKPAVMARVVDMMCVLSICAAGATVLRLVKRTKVLDSSATA
jgi:hypothetical protein